MTHGSSYRPRVLLVDDAPSNLVALDAVLHSLPVQLVHASSGAEALQHIEREPFAVVLLDVQMPEMDGFETARRIRTLAHGRAVPIVFVTAIAREEQYARRGYEAGAADYITKPFDVDVLRARVRAFVDLYRQREEAHNARYEARTRELDLAERRLEAFERISTAALATHDVDAFLHTLLTVFMGVAGSVDTATILLRDGDVLTARASIGLQEDVEAGFSVRIGEGLAGRVAQAATPLFMGADEIGALAKSGWARKRALRALYGVPLVTDGDVIGVAHIGSARVDTFSPTEMGLFRAMVERAAWAVSRQSARFLLHRGLDSAPAGVSIWRAPAFVCEYANNEYRRQYVGGEPLGAPLRPEFVARFQEVLRTSEPQYIDDYPLVHDWDGDGVAEQRFFNVSMHPLRTGLGRAASVLALTIDTTSHVMAQRALKKSDADRARLLDLERAARKDAEIANRAKDEFLATISHELRTPLNAILGWVTSARQGAVKDLGRVLAIIERNARAQARIVEDVLDLSRTVSGKLRLDIVPSDISRPIFGAIEAVRPSAETKQIRLDVNLDDDLGIVAADPDRIQQVVWNLLTNAVKFTPEGGHVTVTAVKRDGKVVVSIQDTGQGIAPEFLPYVFDPFRQADASTTRRHGGLGLGLAIVHQLVQAHGGTIRAQSAGVGLGATFTMELASRTAQVFVQPSDPRSGDTDVSAVRLDAVRVLVVDDEEDSRALVRELLAARGARVVVAGSAEEALRHVPAFRPHVLVSDVGMPESDGYALIRNVRALPHDQGGDTPAIALTAYARSEDERRAVKEGFQIHVTKPVDPAELVLRVADLRRLAS